MCYHGDIADMSTWCNLIGWSLTCENLLIGYHNDISIVGSSGSILGFYEKGLFVC